MSKRLRKKKSNLWVGFIHLVVIFVLVFGGYLLWKSTGNKGFDLQNYLSLDEWMSFSQDTLEQEDLGYAGLKGELAKSLVKMNLKMGKNFSFGKDVDGSVLLKVRVQQSQLDLTYMTLVLKKALRAQGSSILEASVLLENKENQIVARAKDGQIYTVSIGYLPGLLQHIAGVDIARLLTHRPKNLLHLILLQALTIVLRSTTFAGRGELLRRQSARCNKLKICKTSFLL